MLTFLRKYGVQTTIHFPLYEIDGVDFKVDAVDGGTDCNIMKDEGVEATCVNDFVDEGTGYSLVITATEMEAAEVMVYIIDAATKAYLDWPMKIETYGNASAMHAMDFDDAVRGGMTALPNAAAAAAGGLPISAAGSLAMDTLADWVNGGRLDLLLDAIPTTAMRGTDTAATEAKQDLQDAIITEARLAELDAANLPADVAAVPTAAEINAEIVDALNVDTYAEPGQGDPASTASIVYKLGLVYKILTNKILTTATLIAIYNAAGSVVDHKSTISDDATTFTRGDIVSGP